MIKTTTGDGWFRTHTNVNSLKDHASRVNVDGERPENHVDRCAKKLYQRDTDPAAVSVTVSPGIRNRIHPTGRYIRGTLSPTSQRTAPVAQNSTTQLLLKAARDGNDSVIRDFLRKASTVGTSQHDLNARDNTGRVSF